MANLEEAPSLDQSSKWRSIQAVLTLDNALAVKNPPAPSFCTVDSLFVIMCLIGTGTGDDCSRSLLSAEIWLESLSKSSATQQNQEDKASFTRLEEICLELDNLLHADLIPPVQDGRRPQVSDLVDSMIGIFLDAMSSASLHRGALVAHSMFRVNS